MTKKYIIKNIETQNYYCGDYDGNCWQENIYYADYFETIEDAENFIKQESGKFQIETIYDSQ
jgi:hypothetical protein